MDSQTSENKTNLSEQHICKFIFLIT